jgi:DNA-binding GntR family transcriptional regulator
MEAGLGWSNRQVQRTPLGSQIADALRQDIVLGRLKPGTRLSQRALCDQFGTSRMPVRDALRSLLHDGLLVLDGGHHTRVAPLSKDDLLDSFVIEGTLTGLATTRATEHITDADLDELDALHRQMIRVAKGDPGDGATSMASLNWGFHRKINRRSGSHKILAALRVVSVDVPRDFLERLPEYHAKSNTEHARILSAIRKKDGELAGELMTAHVISSGRALISYLETQGVSLVSDDEDSASALTYLPA